MPSAAIAGRARSRAFSICLVLVASAAALASCLPLAWLDATRPPDAAPSTVAPAPVLPAASTSAAATDAVETQRRAAPALAEASAGQTFAERIDELVAMNLEVARLAESGQEEAAVARDREVREAFAALLREVEDADHEALAAISSMAVASTPGATASPAIEPPAPVLAADVRRSILVLAIGTGLARRHALADGAEQAIALTSGVLAVLQARADLAEPLGREVLVGQPFLAAAHEPQVLDLVAQSASGAFPTEVATALLSTLWQNLQRTGVRGSDRLAGLALLLLEDGNASERLAASRLLLLDARYREVLLARLRETGDRELARTVAMAAAQDLPATEAFAVLTRIADVVGQDVSPFLTLAMRGPELLVREYEERLGSDVEPRLRALLVTGAGFAGTPESLELARLALAQDPDPEVRLRALFVLTGAAAATLGEAAIQQALDDPRLGSDPQHLGSIVLAVQNLARAGQRNAVDRLATRLRATAGLSPSSRELLEQVLREALPTRVAAAAPAGGGTGGK